MRVIFCKVCIVSVAAFAVFALIPGPQLVAERGVLPVNDRILAFTLNGRNLPLSSASFEKGTFVFNMPVPSPFQPSSFLFNLSGLQFRDDIRNGNFVGSVLFVDEDGNTELQGPIVAFDSSTFHWIYNYLDNPSAGILPTQPTIDVSTSGTQFFFRQLDEAFPQGLGPGCLKIELGNAAVEPVSPGNPMQVTMQSGNGETVVHQLYGGPTVADVPLTAWGQFGSNVAITSTLVVANTESSPVDVSVQYYDPLGSFSGGVSTSTPAFSTAELVLGAPGQVFSGSSKVQTSPPGAHVSAGVTYEVSVGEQLFGAGLGSPRPGTFNLVQVTRADQTGIAIQNIGSGTAGVEVYFVSNHDIIGTTEFTIPPNGRESKFAHEYFAPPSSQGVEGSAARLQEVTPAASGSVVIISNRDVAVISLLTRDQLPFASLPAGTP